nr:DDE-type integrase/transposase/recombinase [Rhodococcus sp. KBW08]
MWNDQFDTVVQRSPLPGRDHQLLRVAVLRYPLSFREIEELNVRRWCRGQLRDDPPVVRQGGQAYANQLRRRRALPADTWHLDEVFIRVNGTQHNLCRVVDQDGNVVDVLVQSRRNASNRPHTRNDSCLRASHRISDPPITISRHSDDVSRWPTVSWSGRR